MRYLWVIAIVSSFALILTAQQPNTDAIHNQGVLLLKQARTIANSAQPPRLRASLLDDIAALLLQAKEPSAAAAVRDEALASFRAGLDSDRELAQHDETPNSFAFSGLGNAASTAARHAEIHAGLNDLAGARAWIDAALAVAPLITDERERTPILYQIANIQVSIGDGAAAQQTISGIPRENSGYLNPLEDLAEQKARAGNVEAARALAAGMDGYPASSILAHAAIGQAESGDFAGALAAAESIPNGIAKVEALAKIAVQQVRSGDRRGAGATFAHALSTQPGGAALHTVALAQADAGMFESAMALVAAIPKQSYGVQGHDFMQIGVLAAAAKRDDLGREAFAKAYVAFMNEPPPDQERFQVADRPNGTRSTDHKQLSLQSLARAEAESGDFEDASNIAKTLEDRYRWPAELAIASAQARAGDIAAAEKTIAAETRPHGVPAELAVADAKAGDLRTAYDAARSMPPIEMERIFRAYCTPANLADCVAAAGDLTFPERRARAFMGMAENLLSLLPVMLPRQARQLDLAQSAPQR